MSKKQDNGRKGKGAEVRHEVVAQFRKWLEDGQYHIRAREIADKMVQKIRDGRNPWLN